MKQPTKYSLNMDTVCECDCRMVKDNQYGRWFKCEDIADFKKNTVDIKTVELILKHKMSNWAEVDDIMEYLKSKKG